LAADPYKFFRLEARELFEQLSKAILELQAATAADSDEAALSAAQRLLRLAHTLKGAARVVKQREIAERAHAIEESLAPFRGKEASVTRERLTEVQKSIDEIGLRVRALGASPSPTAEVVQRTETSVVEDVLSVRADVSDMDALLEGIRETQALLRPLRASAARWAEVRRLTDALSAEIALATGRGREVVAEMRKSLETIEHDFARGVDLTERELRQVRDLAEQLRLSSVEELFTTLERTAHDAARALGKRVRFLGKGARIRVDSPVLGAVQGALVQLIRNAVAHGIESESERARTGKPAIGEITVEVMRRGRLIVFRCQDDGRGIDLAAVRRVAVRRGISPGEVERLDVAGLLQLLMRGGISTTKVVTEVAGRGIGLDVVREAVTRMGGEMTVRTEEGKGATFEMVMPVSMASLEVLTVDAGGTSAAVPLASIRRTLQASALDLSHAAEGESLAWEGMSIPFLPLVRVFGVSATTARSRMSHAAGNSAPGLAKVVILETTTGLMALGIDQLLGATTVVLRPLPSWVPLDEAVAGACFDADGNPQIVLDADGLMGHARRVGAAAAVLQPRAASILVIDDSLTTRMLEQSILESAGYQVDTATSAEEGWERACEKTYGLFLVDVEMPGMDGFEFVTRVRADSSLRTIPAILVTSRASVDDVRRGREAGAQGHVNKGEFNQAHLLAHIQELLEPGRA
jgi:two-component system, chemotaxis family, sensor kinase CheA